jgi:CubicO group peptidase (beta-lactamase class C family)
VGRRRSALLLAAALLGGRPAAAQTPLPAPNVAAIESAIAAEMSRHGIPGMSAAVALDYELRWSAGFGRADIENNVPATVSTVYRLGSIAKTITATAVLQLAEKGKLDLDAPVQKYVASFPAKQWPLTSRHLLSHMGGVRWYAPGEMESTRHYPSVGDGLAMFKDDPLVFEPGTSFLYSSYGYNLLGAVVEGASGMPYMDYVRRNIFEPAGMERAQADNVYAIVPNRARGYQKSSTGELRNSALADTSNKIPGGGMLATAEDVARFAMALQGGVLLQKESLARMMTRQTTRDSRMTGAGLGVFLGDRDGVREVWHTGGQPQVSTVLYMRPDRRVSVALLTNLEGIGPNLLELARHLAAVATK